MPTAGRQPTIVGDATRSSRSADLLTARVRVAFGPDDPQVPLDLAAPVSGLQGTGEQGHPGRTVS
jgi:hypothetical protein